MKVAWSHAAPLVAVNDVSAPAPALLMAIICGETADVRYAVNTAVEGVATITGTAPTRTMIRATRSLRTAAEIVVSPTARPVTVALVSVLVTDATLGLLDDQVTAENRGMRVPFASLACTYNVTL
jgi:hypothetical protein